LGIVLFFSLGLDSEALGSSQKEKSEKKNGSKRKAQKGKNGPTRLSIPKVSILGKYIKQ
jgi:hypothetical protein